MRSFALLVVTSVAFLALASSGSAEPQTTNPGAYATVRVTINNKGGVTMSATRARRGSTAIFLLSNPTTSARVLAVGDASLTHRRGTGFAVKLAKGERKRVLLYLTYRGPLPVTVGANLKGVFRVI